MEIRTHRRCTLILAALLTAATLGACAHSDEASPASALPSPTAATSDTPASGAASTNSHEAIPADPALPPPSSPSAGCRAMDEVFSRFLSSSPEGTRYLSLVDTSDQEGDAQERREAWMSTVSALRTKGYDQLEAVASDEESVNALHALTTYESLSRSLDEGTIPQYENEEAARQALLSGREPEQNEEYTRASLEVTNAHILLSQCLEHWPVLF